MTNALPSEPTRPSTRRYLGPTFVALVTLAMLFLSWGTWPDPLVDYGAQLYIPWQLSRGAVLYRDVAIYNGPLASYANALAFKLFGVGLHTLEAVNFAVLVGVLAMAYQLTVRASGRIAATFGGMTVALVFAFGQGVSIGNYNWMTPYVHDLTHGVALGFVAIACADRFLRTNCWRWASASGLATGAAFLTKAEPAAACAVAVVGQLAAGLWIARADARRAVRTSAVVLGSALLVVIVAALLLATAMPVSAAVRGVLGSWPWAFDRRITSLNFYRRLVGLSDVRGNLVTMLAWTLGYAIVAAALVVPARLRRGRGRAAVVVAFVASALLLACAANRINWPAAMSPVPVGLGLALVMTSVAVVRRRDRSLAPREALRLGGVLFGLALLAKIVLQVQPFHYGFALAMPAALVVVAMVAQDLPAWIDARGGRGAIVRAGALAMWLGFVLFAVWFDLQHWQYKRWTIQPDGPDGFRGTTRGLEVQAAYDWIGRNVPSGGTVGVYPQGLMINYLTRRNAPTPYISFMPPEVLSAGEATMLDAMQSHPPDAIVIDRSAVRDGQFDLDRSYQWGAATLRWIDEHYELAERVTLPEPMPTLYHLEILRPKRRGLLVLGGT